MKVLAIDTCGKTLSLCASDGKRRFSRNLPGGGKKDDALFAECEKLVRKAGFAINEIEGLVAATGPGSFTGIRVGLTFASILSSSLRRPVAGVSRFEAAAFAALGGSGTPRSCAIVFPGSRDEIFFQGYALEHGWPFPVGEPAVVLSEDWPAVWKKSKLDCLAGPAAAMAAKLVKAEDLVCWNEEPGAKEALEPGVRRISEGRLSLAPLYIKPAYYERGLAAKK